MGYAVGLGLFSLPDVLRCLFMYYKTKVPPHAVILKDFFVHSMGGISH